MNNPFSLDRKVVLVTGASSGIGRATAVQCSRMGARLIISGRNPERLQETYNLLENHNPHVKIIADLNNQKDISDLVDQIQPIDGIVHCAGITKTIPFQFIDESMLLEIMQINFFAPVFITQSIVRRKKIKNGSSIIFISSVEGIYRATPANSMYSASKGAINGMVKTMAIELAGKGIRVNSINPGMIKTPILSDGLITPAQLQEDMKRYPLKRYGNPDEIAYGVIYMLSDTSQWITGSNLLIDGGLTLI